MRRSKRDPDGTRAAILQAAGKLLAQDGPEGLSVSQVAQLAGVNRGTAYQHFPSRESLLAATTAWVSDQLRRAVFGDEQHRQSAPGAMDPMRMTEQMATFAMENPEFGRVWLFEVLSSSKPTNDPFWNEFRSQFEQFAKSDLAQPGIDVEVHAVIMLIGTFLWPVFARAHSRTAKERQQMAKRFSNEMLRLSLHGTMRPEKFPELSAKVDKAVGIRKRTK
ncbi:TetR/AcrR family transcriptional regulator [Sinimarinibacterium thermocellulolyticum]|uniref:TetR/AcrR family transcriptional regulator n=1 Tax=Sinimarinibacterium thermocellulolyticum TaxID=3170016 RepID=A0ABV2AEN3_9GAMM